MRYLNLNVRNVLVAPAGLILLAAPALQASETDNRIESSAKNSYNFKEVLKDDNVRIDVSDGVVTLTGSVHVDYHRTLAENTVSELPGVKRVINQIVVAGDQPAEHSDAWITMKVKTVLAFHKNVSATSTEVVTQNGEVTLSGKADSEAQKQLTGEYAKDVEGVTSVKNNLEIAKPAKSSHSSLGETIDDSSITAQIKTTLLFHKSTHTLATKVVTHKGVVTLRGQAQNGAERDLVSKLAEDIKGVKHVNNRMTVNPS